MHWTEANGDAFHLVKDVSGSAVEARRFVCSEQTVDRSRNTGQAIATCHAAIAMRFSINRRGNGWSSAMAECFYCNLKNELVLLPTLAKNQRKSREVTFLGGGIISTAPPGNS